MHHRILIVSLLAATSARAQSAEPTGASLDRWQPGLDAEAVGSVNVGRVPLVTSYDLWVELGYAHDLILVTDRDAGSSGALVGPRLFAHLGGSYTLLPWLQVGANLPVVLYQDRGDPPPSAFGTVGSLTAGGLGDLTVTAKLAPFSPARTWVDLAFLVGVGVPTHVPGDAYLGDDVGFSVGAAASRTLADLEMSANLGYHWRPTVAFLDADIGPEFRLALGAGYDLDSLTDLPLTAEVSWMLATRHDAPFSNINETPSELLFGATWRGFAPIEVNAAAGFGLVAGVGTPAVRLLLGARFVERPSDRDGDRNPDHTDACPEKPEDIDGFEDSDGCPDPDNDQDGIFDDIDECPDEPESFNDVEDEDGCPDTAVTIAVGRLDLGENVHFEVNKAVLKRKSRLLLNEVADVLAKHPEITKLCIEGHTDSDGTDENNLTLSRARAKAVRDYLISRGIDGDRLTSEGFGESRPVASNETARGRAANRRVEFLIEELVREDGRIEEVQEPPTEEPTGEPPDGATTPSDEPDGAPTAGRAPSETEPGGTRARTTDEKPPNGRPSTTTKSARTKAGETKAGGKKASEKKAGDKAGGKKAGDKKASEKTSGDKASGEKAVDEKPSEKKAGDKASGKNVGEQKAGEKEAGDKASGKKAVDKKPSEKKAGDEASGKKAGDEASGK